MPKQGLPAIEAFEQRFSGLRERQHARPVYPCSAIATVCLEEVDEWFFTFLTLH